MTGRELVSRSEELKRLELIMDRAGFIRHQAREAWEFRMGLRTEVIPGELFHGDGCPYRRLVEHLETLRADFVNALDTSISELKGGYGDG